MNSSLFSQLLELLPKILFSVGCGFTFAVVLDWFLRRYEIIVRDHFGEEYLSTPRDMNFMMIVAISCVSALLAFFLLPM